MNVFLGFTAAAVTGVVTALFLRRMLGRFALRMSSANQVLFNSTTSFLALAGAGYVNSFVMRSDELRNGISVYDQEGNEAGKSKAAAMRAVNHTSLSRMAIAFYMVFVPGFIIGMMQKMNLLPRMFLLRSIAEVGIIGAALYFGLSASVAAYHIVGQVKPNQLEKEF